MILTLAGDDEAPVNAVPGAQTVAEDTALAFTGANLISVTDPDTDLVSTQLTVTNGILNVTLSGGATINPGGNGSADLTVSGTQADINATLASLTYQGNLNFNGGDTLTVLSTDATTGTALTDSDTVAKTVTAMNDDPVAVDDGPITVTFNTPQTGNVLGNDNDAEGDSLSVTEFTVAGVSGLTFAGGNTATIPGVGYLASRDQR